VSVLVEFELGSGDLSTREKARGVLKEIYG
jgi:hypothetical protein